jgi:nicotinamidase-related amidase
VIAVAACGKYLKLPTILTTSFESGPNGPLVPELKEMFPSAPYIARPGNINAWDNEDFVNAIKKTGRKQLIIANDQLLRTGGQEIMPNKALTLG